MLLYILALAGVVFHVLMKFRDSYSKKEQFDWKNQGIFAAISFATACILVYFRKDILDMMQIEMEIGGFLCFLFGYFADSLWKNVKSESAKKLNVDPNE